MQVSCVLEYKCIFKKEIKINSLLPFKNQLYMLLVMNCVCINDQCGVRVKLIKTNGILYQNVYVYAVPNVFKNV